MTIASSIRFILCLTLLVVVAAPAMAQSGKVVLNTSATVGGPIVRLGDVASIEVADAAMQTELQQLELMPAPSIDTAAYLTINDIRSILAARGISSSVLEVTGSNRVRMQRGSVTETIQHATVEPKRIPRRTFRGQVQPEPSSEIMTVAHVIRNVRRGEVLRHDDVEMRDLSVVRREDSYPTDLSNVIGKEVTRGIAADRPIASEDIREPVIVRRNEVVTVYAYAGNIVVRREMMALTDAGLGELIEVQPIDPTLFGRARQAERFQAQVKGPGEAVVMTGHVTVPTSKPMMPVPQSEIQR
ncbi:flagellar basal body P-ring formation chaperone FlgA [Bremerella cremea]|uniref:flagellar basal body P-ring formation chaperone FlgA n=1 Tax=Bremerella cremea TaxID=1031537 RepID=UPI0031E7DDB5